METHLSICPPEIVRFFADVFAPDAGICVQTTYRLALWATVSHRNLATVCDLKDYRGTPMIIMEFVDGGMLAGRIPLPLDEAIEVMLQITEVVGCLHKAGVVHRDIKPRNIAFTGDGELKLLDFGLARLEREATMSGVDAHVVVGTPAYLSPEAHAHHRANPSFDFWALTVTFYELLTGRRPFDGSSEANSPRRSGPVAGR